MVADYHIGEISFIIGSMLSEKTITSCQLLVTSDDGETIGRGFLCVSKTDDKK